MAESDKKNEVHCPNDAVRPAASIEVIEAGDLKGMGTRELDEAAKYLAGHDEFGPLTPEMEKKLVKKIDAWILPLALFTATLAAVDKVELGTAALYGLRTDTHMVGQEYSWLGSILPLGTLCGMFPASYLVHRLPPGKLLASTSLIWSILTCVYAACHNWAGFMALRFILGFLEAAISPCLTMIVVSFYKKSEQAPRNSLVFAYFSSVFNGFFAWVVGKIPDSAPLLKWQYLYIMTGSINVLWSFFILYIMPDSPMNAKFLNTEEKYHATKRLAENRTGIASRVWKWRQALEAFTDVRVWLIFCLFCVLNIPNGGLQTFGSIIINNLGFNALDASLLTIPFGVLATSGAWFFGYIAAKWHNRRVVTCCIALILPIVGTAIVYALPQSHVAGQMVGLYLMYFYWPPYVVGISLIQANTAGQTKKAVSYSWAYIGYAVGNLVGPQTFRAQQAPQYTAGVITMLACYCVSIGLLLIYWALSAWENKKKDEKYGKPEHVHEGTVEGFMDITDKEQEAFRYTT